MHDRSVFAMVGAVIKGLIGLFNRTGVQAYMTAAKGFEDVLAKLKLALKAQPDVHSQALTCAERALDAQGPTEAVMRALKIAARERKLRDPKRAKS